MTAPPEPITPSGPPVERSRRRRSRTWWMLVAAVPCIAVALVNFGWSAEYAFIRHHAMWDDFLLVGLVWLIAAIGCAVLLRVILSLVAPERWLPRWLAATMLVLAILAALLVLLYVAYANSFGP